MASTDEASLHPDGSVFGVDLIEQTVELGRLDREPNHTSYDVAVLEFDDGGAFVDGRQLAAATRCIRGARESNENGALVVLFIHGWRHGARWDRATGEGDAHFAAFRSVLRALALREAERYLPEPGGRRVVGLYVGWNGYPRGSVLSRLPGLQVGTFWGRYATARRIGDGEDVRTALGAIVAATKDPIDGRPESPLVLVGHSMGALILESAFLSLLSEEDEPLVRRATPTVGACVETRRGDAPIAFPDLLLAVNSAADSRIAKEIKAWIDRQGLTRTLDAGDVGYAPPFFVSATSPADRATRIVWPLSQLPRVWRRTDGHDRSLYTHALELEEERAPCPPGNALGVDFGQNWHCLRVPDPPRAATPSFAIDLPVRERRGVDDVPDHARYRLSPLDGGEAASPAWVFQVPPALVSDHNDIFNSRASSLMLALIQISGAVVSLAEDVHRNFEGEA